MPKFAPHLNLVLEWAEAVVRAEVEAEVKAEVGAEVEVEADFQKVLFF